MRNRKRTPYFGILILIAVLIHSKLFSQSAGVPPGGAVYGYVCLHNGDTLKGLVKWKGKYIENNLAEIMFTAKNGNSKIFSAGAISGFGHYTGGKVRDLFTPQSPENENYESVLSLEKGQPVFMYRYLNGRIKVLQHRSTKGMFSGFKEELFKIEGIYFCFNPIGGLSVGESYKTSYDIIHIKLGLLSYFVSKDKGALFEVNKKNYDTLFPTLFGDCPQIGQEIAKNPDLANFKYFIILAEVYNQICEGYSESH
jgi:hypothetical protein